MQYKPYGKTGKMVSAIGFGGMRFKKKTMPTVLKRPQKSYGMQVKGASTTLIQRHTIATTKARKSWARRSRICPIPSMFPQKAW